jgi:hypothetical protein
MDKKRGKQGKQSIHSLHTKIELRLFLVRQLGDELLPSGCASVREASAQYTLKPSEVRAKMECDCARLDSAREKPVMHGCASAHCPDPRALL